LPGAKRFAVPSITGSIQAHLIHRSPVTQRANGATGNAGRYEGRLTRPELVVLPGHGVRAPDAGGRFRCVFVCAENGTAVDAASNRNGVI
jgi:hypothetical protein